MIARYRMACAVVSGLLAVTCAGAVAGNEAIAPAAPPADKPDDCRIEIAEPRIDYGEQTSGQLALGADGHLYFARRVVPMMVVCNTSRPIALRLAAQRGPGGAPRFATDGAVAVMLSEARLDGRPARLANQRDPAASVSQMLLEAGDLVQFRGPDAGGVGRVLSALITVAPRLSAAEGRVRDVTRVEAHLALDVVALD